MQPTASVPPILPDCNFACSRAGIPAAADGGKLLSGDPAGRAPRLAAHGTITALAHAIVDRAGSGHRQFRAKKTCLQL
jgi:hypothetical protein